MMDDQQMKQVSAWLDKTMSAEETELFLQARINDPEFDEACKAMQEITLALSEIDRDLQPSPQFHGNVMKRLEAECMTAIKDETQGRATGEEIKTTQGPDHSRKPVRSRRIGHKIMQTLSGWRPKQWIALTAGLCFLVFAATIGLQSLPYGVRYKSSESTAAAEPSMMAPDVSMEEDAARSKQSTGGTGLTEMPVPPVDNGSVAPEDFAQKIIYTAYMSIEVDRYDAAAGTLKAAVLAVGGYLTNEDQYTMDEQGRKAGNLSLRIPSDQFAKLLETAGTLGKVNNQSTNAQDVTTQFVDVEARLKVMEAKETRLLELLSKAGSMADLLAVEQELGNTRSELESLKGQLRYLTNQTDYSTLNVSLVEKPLAASSIQVEGFAGLWLRIKEAFLLGINGVIASVSNLIVGLVRVFPVIIILMAGFWFLWRKWLKAWLKSHRHETGGDE